ncbi:MAG TPA: hypothetical protein VEJ88_05115, partial [Dissulfurispiraceae bacterium]|nr:hypothetical protein [Dissulfurispiraceae bacterium]
VEERLNSFSKEMETLRKRVDETAGGSLTTPMASSGRKNLWTRIFSKEPAPGVEQCGSPLGRPE